MGKLKKIGIGIGVLFLILIVLGIASTFTYTNKTGSQSSTNTQTQTTQNVATKDPSQMALQLSDLPANYSLKERTERTKSDVSQDALDLGWQKGYYVRYARMGAQGLLDTTVLEQRISIYPIENITKILSVAYNSTSNTTYGELSKPNIGDDSRAFKVTATGNFGNQQTAYFIEFIKMNVYEQIGMSGTTTDSELLKAIANTALQKIE